MIGFKHYYNSNELSSGSGGCSFRRFSSQPLDAEPEVDTRFKQYVEGTLTELLPEDFGDITEIPEHMVYNTTFDDIVDDITYNILLNKIELPDSVTTLRRYCLSYTTVKEIIISSNISTIDDYAITHTAPDGIIDFTKAKSIPTRVIGTDNTYSSLFNSSIVEIKVPTSLYSAWIARTDWSDLASKIVAI